MKSKLVFFTSLLFVTSLLFLSLSFFIQLSLKTSHLLLALLISGSMISFWERDVLKDSILKFYLFLRRNQKLLFMAILLVVGALILTPFSYTFFAAIGKLHIYFLLQRFLNVISVLPVALLLPFVTKSKQNSVAIPKYLVPILLTIIVIWAAALRFINIGSFSIYHDEIWYASAVKSYISEDKSTLWNYVTQEPTETKYPWLITVLLGTFIKAAGEYSETTLRLPFAIFSLLSVVATYYLAVITTNSRYLGLLSATVIALADIPVYLGRFTRQYSLLELLTLVLAIGLVKSLGWTRQTGKWNILQVILPLILVYFIAVYISPFAYSFFVVIGLYAVGLLAFSNDTNKRNIILLMSLLGVGYFLLEWFQIVTFLDLRRLLSQQFLVSFSWMRNSNYLQWLYSFLMLPAIFTASLSVLGSVVVLHSRKPERVLLPLFCWVPLIMLLINSYHSHDFRYISYIMPFAVILAMLAIRNTLFLFISKKSVHLWASLSLVAVTVVLLARPSVPGTVIPYLTVPALADWKTDEGKRIHRRAVAPKYSETYPLMRNYFNESTAVVFFDGETYLEISDQVDYWYLEPWSNSNKMKNMRNGDAATFFDVLERYEAVLLAGAYFHGLTPEVQNIVLSNCQNAASSVTSAFHFEYDPSYLDRDTYWPNLFICQN